MYARWEEKIKIDVEWRKFFERGWGKSLGAKTSSMLFVCFLFSLPYVLINVLRLCRYRNGFSRFSKWIVNLNFLVFIRNYFFQPFFS